MKIKGRKGNCYEKYDKKRVTALVLTLIMVFALSENGELCVSYPTSVLIEDGYGGLESVSDAGIIFTPSIYVYPEGSSSIEGSNKNISTNLVNEKDFSTISTTPLEIFPATTFAISTFGIPPRTAI